MLAVPLRAQQRGAGGGGGGAAQVGEAVRGLAVTARVLIIGAHPDDEDSRLIAWLSRGHHAEVAYLSLTRGDGGQNLLGDQLGQALGVIRTQELLAARRIDGARQYFTRAYDFGFSKTAAETFQHWPRDSVLEDVVTVIRAFKPHVIVSVFTGTPRDGHGHHQAAGILAREAWTAAADTVRFPPSRTAGLGPWTPLKFYQNTSYWRNEGATFEYDAGAYDPLLGESYAQIAAESRSQHKSQGMGMMARPGATTGSLRRLWTRVPAPVDPAHERSIFDGIDTTWARVAAEAPPGPQRATLDSLDAAVSAAEQGLDLFDPARDVPALGRVAALLARAACADSTGGSTGAHVATPCARLNPDVERTVADGVRKATNALRLASGIDVQANVHRPGVAPGDTIGLGIHVYDRGGIPLRVRGMRVFNGSAVQRVACGSACGLVAADSAFTRTVTLTGGDTLSSPWWLARGRHGDLFAAHVDSLSERSRERTTQPRVTVSLDLLAPGAGAADPIPLRVSVPVEQRFADPLRGAQRRPLAVVPAVSVVLDRTVAYAPSGTPLRRSVAVHVRSGTTSAQTVGVRLHLPPGLVARPASASVRLAGFGAASTVTFHPRGQLAAGWDTVRAVATTNGARYDGGYVPIAYAHIEPQELYRPAAEAVSAVHVALPPGVRVGYVRGVGDNVAPMLSELGVPVTVIDPADLGTIALSRFTTIVIGTRAYATRPALVANNARLLAWVHAGGRLVVQYGQYEMMKPGIMPYPISLARPAARVTDETAPVRVLRPQDALLTSPNHIGAADWLGWVQERSTYMPSTFDAHYTPLLEMHDPGEPDHDGALLEARYGKGTYIYVTLALFRQLPAGVPGGARIFANLLGGGKMERQSVRRSARQ